ncbi:MAG TPA: MFS transporter [Anaerolineae bacterium]|nr:MFS transporter [Anaerolineae bacterium]
MSSYPDDESSPDPSAHRGWKRNLAILWFGQLIAISGFSVFMPFLPYYVQELGITEVKQVAFWAGLLTSAQAVTMALVAPIWGSLADRYGRKIMVVRAMFGGAVIVSLMGFVGNVWQLVVLRAIQGTLTGTVSAATTLVASSAPPQRRGFALGTLQMAIYLGGSVGPLLGGFIADSMGYRPTFWVTGALLFVAGILVATMVHEDFVPVARGGEQAPLLEGLLIVFRTRALMLVCGIRVLMRMGVRIIGPVLPLFIQSIATPGTKIASLTGTIAGFGSAASAVGAVFMGRLADRIGPQRILIVCGAAASVLYAAQGRVQTPTQLLALNVASGVAMGGILASISTLQAALAPKGRYGAVYGVDTSLVAAANAISPMIGAALTATVGLTSVFYGAAVVYALATVIVLIVVPGVMRARAEAQA